MTEQQVFGTETTVRQAPATGEPTPAGATGTPAVEAPAPQPAPLAAPPMPGLPPAAYAEGQPSPAPAVKKDRRVLRAVLRWTAAVTVFAALGASTAYGITRMERTDVPGLATESDGRWDYPRLTRPPLPQGSPRPFAEENLAGAHFADLRELVLPAPRGAKVDPVLKGEDGWLPTKDFLAEYASKEDREEFAQTLVDNGLRHVAARGWTTPDGTHTRIYLLQFGTAAVEENVYRGDGLTAFRAPKYAVRGATESGTDDAYPPAARVEDVRRTVYTETKPYGPEQVRQAYLSAGDTMALIVQSRKGHAEAVPFQQTVTLQSQLLG
ncbi:hypothetical protein [Streptomyces sp. NPDC002952]|uniref:hypothetical protein n=1 Tax=Streptomyces sp. NPDC002952 TaxID=3364673 RepID=UPI0036B8DCEA